VIGRHSLATLKLAASDASCKEPASVGHRFHAPPGLPGIHIAHAAHTAHVRSASNAMRRMDLVQAFDRLGNTFSTRPGEHTDPTRKRGFRLPSLALRISAPQVLPGIESGRKNGGNWRFFEGAKTPFSVLEPGLLSTSQ
jgi:hypothetical protein